MIRAADDYDFINDRLKQLRGTSIVVCTGKIDMTCWYEPDRNAMFYLARSEYGREILQKYEGDDRGKYVCYGFYGNWPADFPGVTPLIEVVEQAPEN